MNKHRWVLSLFDSLGAQFYLLNEAEWEGLQKAIFSHKGDVYSAFTSLAYADGCEPAVSLADVVGRVSRRGYVIAGEAFGVIPS